MNRELIERLASAKYDSSKYVMYANGAVITINGEDWEPVVREHDRAARDRDQRVAEDRSLLLVGMQEDAPASSSNSKTLAEVE
jgi:hypothetical protein